MIRAFTTLSLLCAGAAWAQPATAPAEFEVAAVKVNDTPLPTNDMHEIDQIQTSPTSLTMQHIRLKSAIKWAWSVSQYQVSGPPWLDTERYDIFAKTGSPVTEDQLRHMLRKLIEDRFKLAFHNETKVLPAYFLSVGKGGPRLKPSEGGETVFDPGRNMNITVRSMTLGEFAELASGPLQAPVLNRTGLNSRFDFALNLTPYMTNDRMGLEDLPGILSQAFEQQLGLKLESRKSPLDVLVIDNIGKIPPES
jgi:uncharacterized protein (TIGR03435 family)